MEHIYAILPLSPLYLNYSEASRRLLSGHSSVDQQRCAGGKLRCVGSEVKDGSRDFFAGAKSAHGMQGS